jgi:hypothetical protein
LLLVEWSDTKEHHLESQEGMHAPICHPNNGFIVRNNWRFQPITRLTGSPNTGRLKEHALGIRRICIGKGLEGDIPRASIEQQ